MIVSSLNNVEGKNRQKSIDVEWKPSAEQEGRNIIGFMAVDEAE